MTIAELEELIATAKYYMSFSTSVEEEQYWQKAIDRKTRQLEEAVSDNDRWWAAEEAHKEMQ